ncbi:MAG TPA: hypothetical protein VIV27_07300 [Halioglobus sp.]
MRYTLPLMVPHEEAILLSTRSTYVCVIGLVLLLQACAAAPPASAPSVATASVAAPPAAEAPAVEEQQPPPELTLHLPDQTAASGACDPATVVDRNLLTKGFNALAGGDHKEAVNYFRRYQRLEASPGASWEAEIAIAYDKMLPQSPYYNWRTARESYLRLKREQPAGLQAQEQILLMRDALEILSDLHTQINDLQSETRTLSENLEKREEALRRLRELTLGQKGATQ